MKGTLLVAGSSSDAGKSALTAGLCRWLVRNGVRVAPFKAQNMSNNSCVTPGGAEIGRAQFMQAQAAHVEPVADMNPILLKPGGDRRSQVVVRGQALGEIDAMHFASDEGHPTTQADGPGGVDGSGRLGTLHRDHLRELAGESLERLRARYDVVICEGAGSPAEINLRAGDIANMGLARTADMPVIVVGDIDRGGVFASLYGTLALLDAADQSLVSGFVINKFRGAEALLRPGLDTLRDLTGRPVIGVIPWQNGVWLDAEDSLASVSLQGLRGCGPYGHETLRVAVVRLPRISNFTDLDALACEPGVVVRFVDTASEVADADLVVLPGTRATVADLDWMRSRGLDEALLVRDRPILGICGGYQMLATVIDDSVESRRGLVRGLGLLPVSVWFDSSKTLGRPVGEAYGCRVAAYEIHHGTVRIDDDAEPFLDGCRRRHVWGTTWHGALENDAFRRAFLRRVAESAGRAFEPAPDVSFSAMREAGLDAMGDAVERHLDTPFLERLITNGAPAGMPVVGVAAGLSADQNRIRKVKRPVRQSDDQYDQGRRENPSLESSARLDPDLEWEAEPGP